MKILDRLPYSKKHSTLSVREEIVSVKPYQIIVWVSVAPASPREWNPATPAFPAILDIGTNPAAPKIIATLPLPNSIVGPPTNLAITPDRTLALVANSVNAVAEAGAWKHVPDNKLYLNEGIIIRPDEGIRRTPLPLLGLRALTHNELVTTIDGSRLEVTIRTARKMWWPW